MGRPIKYVNLTAHSSVFNGSIFQREFKGVAKGALHCLLPGFCTGTN